MKSFDEKSFEAPMRWDENSFFYFGGGGGGGAVKQRYGVMKKYFCNMYGYS